MAKEVTYRSARRLGEVFDSRRGVDFRRFINGFNFTDYDPSVVYEVKKYVLNRVRTIQQSIGEFNNCSRYGYENNLIADLIDAKGRKLTKWTNYTTIDDLILENITWNGVINGRIRVIERPADLGRDSLITFLKSC